MRAKLGIVTVPGVSCINSTSRAFQTWETERGANHSRYSAASGQLVGAWANRVVMSRDVCRSRTFSAFTRLAIWRAFYPFPFVVG